MVQTISSWIGPAILAVFGLAYILVFMEEKLRLRKSKPVMVAAGLIWILVAIAFYQEGRGPEVAEKLRHVVLEYAELLLFLLSAMSFVNTMVERNVFEVLATPDDEGHRKDHPDEKTFRARQNVVLELGMLLTMLGRDKVAIILKDQDKMERPSDIQGLIYIPFKNDLQKEAGALLAKEMAEQGYSIDVKRL